MDQKPNTTQALVNLKVAITSGANPGKKNRRGAEMYQNGTILEGKLGKQNLAGQTITFPIALGADELPQGLSQITAIVNAKNTAEYGKTVFCQGVLKIEAAKLDEIPTAGQVVARFFSRVTGRA